MRKKFYEATGAVQSRMSRAMDKRFAKAIASSHPDRAASATAAAAGKLCAPGRTSVPPTLKAPQQPGRGR
jgi:hypothetical protein